MAHDFIAILRTISANYGITIFKDRKRFRNTLQGNNDQNTTKEIRFLQRLSDLGYVSCIVKKDNTPEEVNILSDELQNDECMDSVAAREVTEALFLVINEAKEQERVLHEERKKQVKLLEYQEKIIAEQKKRDNLETILLKFIRIFGVGMLDKPDFCRAWLKDMAMGDYVDEITVLSMIVNIKMRKKILRSLKFNRKKENLVNQLEQEYNS
jgi:hypothetical protein